MEPNPAGPKRILALAAFPLFIIALATLGIAFRSRIADIFLSASSIRSWVEARGSAAPLVFVALQIIQVVVFVIPGEFTQIAGGFLFGIAGGSFWSTVGILIGSAINFAVGRALGRPFVETVFGKERIEPIEKATESGTAVAGFFLLFVIPGLPFKDALCYFAGMSRLPFAFFVLASTLGRLPGIVGSAWIGSAAFNGQLVVAVAVLVAASVLFVVGLVFKDRIIATISRAVRRPGS